MNLIDGSLPTFSLHRLQYLLDHDKPAPKMNNSIYNVSPVTAQSLEKIHTLADRPTRERRGRAPSRPPLVLYIFKIPGRSGQSTESRIGDVEN